MLACEGAMVVKPIVDKAVMGELRQAAIGNQHQERTRPPSSHRTAARRHRTRRPPSLPDRRRLLRTRGKKTFCPEKLSVAGRPRGQGRARALRRHSDCTAQTTVLSSSAWHAPWCEEPTNHPTLAGAEHERGTRDSRVEWRSHHGPQRRRSGSRLNSMRYAYGCKLQAANERYSNLAT
jgi:hypothetical protein